MLEKDFTRDAVPILLKALRTNMCGRILPHENELLEKWLNMEHLLEVWSHKVDDKETQFELVEILTGNVVGEAWIQPGIDARWYATEYGKKFTPARVAMIHQDQKVRD